MNVEKNSELLRVYEMLKAAPVTRRALRFYEEQGLMLPAGRDQFGRRMYLYADLMRLQIIRTLRVAGLSLAAIRDVLDSRVLRPDDPTPDAWIDRVLSVLGGHSEALGRQMEKMQQAEFEIRTVVDWVRDHRPALQDRPEECLADDSTPLLVRALLFQPSDLPTLGARPRTCRRRPCDFDEGEELPFTPPTW